MSKIVISNLYETSNLIDKIDVTISDKAKSLYKELLSCEGAAKTRQTISNKLCAELCKCFKMVRIEVRVCNTAQDSKTKNGVCVSRTMGKYIDNQLMVVIFNKTAVRKQIVAIKTFADTLLHEFVHGLDRRYYKFPDSPHTSGFYKRISDLKTKLQ